MTDGISREELLTEPLREGADLMIDTSDLPLGSLRRLIAQHFGAGSDAEESRLVVSLISFGYRFGLPREADLVFDARFLRNPHYDPILQPQTGLDAAVGAFIEADPDFATFFAKMADLIDMLLPRFVQEGKKYAAITIGCTGGRHRSVYLVEKLARHLADRIASAQESGEHGPRLAAARDAPRTGPGGARGGLPDRAAGAAARRCLGLRDTAQQTRRFRHRRPETTT